VTATVVVAITIGAVSVIATGGGSPSNGNRSWSVQVKIDLKEALHELAAVAGWFLSPQSTANSGPSYHRDCAKSATGSVGQFLADHRCQQFATATRTIAKRGTNSLVAFSWVLMPKDSWADQYKHKVDLYKTGNPPGVSSAFNGRCYASGSDNNGDTVWTVEVQPTGQQNVDWEMLQAAARKKYPMSYLRKHCPV
jgi:hypothetical protein